jgi:hypothetical protein
MRHGTTAFGGLAPSVPRLRARPPRGASVRARLRSTSVDRELASGMAPWRSPVHASRALQLTTPRRRRVLAASLERLIDHAERPRGITAAIAPCPEQVADARSLIRRVAAQLRSDGPVDARGVVRLEALLCDGNGPCYVRSDPQALTTAIQTAVQWLNPPD